jgi:hypothetical protein
LTVFKKIAVKLSGRGGPAGCCRCWTSDKNTSNWMSKCKIFDFMLKVGKDSEDVFAGISIFYKF